MIAQGMSISSNYHGCEVEISEVEISEVERQFSKLENEICEVEMYVEDFIRRVQPVSNNRPCEKLSKKEPLSQDDNPDSSVGRSLCEFRNRMKTINRKLRYALSDLRI